MQTGVLRLKYLGGSVASVQLILLGQWSAHVRFEPHMARCRRRPPPPPSALQLFVSFGLLNYSSPWFPFLCLLFPIIYTHLPQIISHVIISSQSWPSFRSCCVWFPFINAFNYSFIRHSFNMPHPTPATSCILPGLSIVKTFDVPIYMFSLLFLNTHVGRLLTIRPSFHNCTFLAVLEFFRAEGAGLAPNPQPGRPGCLSSSGFYPLTCPASVSLPVATLPPA